MPCRKIRTRVWVTDLICLRRSTVLTAQAAWGKPPMNILYWLIKLWLAISNQRPGYVQGPWWLSIWKGDLPAPDSQGQKTEESPQDFDRVAMQILSCLNTLETFWTHWLLEPAWRWICRSHDHLLPSELGLMDFEQQKKCWFFWSSPLCEIFLHIVVGEIPGWRALWPTPSKTAVFEASIWNCGF